MMRIAEAVYRDFGANAANCLRDRILMAPRSRGLWLTTKYLIDE
jgi:hypothetical protein